MFNKPKESSSDSSAGGSIESVDSYPKYKVDAIPKVEHSYNYSRNNGTVAIHNKIKQTCFTAVETVCTVS